MGLQRHPSLRISKIRVGRRHRRDLGDIDSLAKSIADIGLLHPIVLRSDGRLIAGERRLQACKSLGWKQVPVRVVNIDQIVRGEFAENAYRKDFLPSEIDAIRRVMEPLQRAAAKENQRQEAVAKRVRKFRNLLGPPTSLVPSPGSRAVKFRRSKPWSKQRKHSRNTSATSSTSLTARMVLIALITLCGGRKMSG